MSIKTLDESSWINFVLSNRRNILLKSIESTEDLLKRMNEKVIENLHKEWYRNANDSIEKAGVKLRLLAEDFDCVIKDLQVQVNTIDLLLEKLRRWERRKYEFLYPREGIDEVFDPEDLSVPELDKIMNSYPYILDIAKK